MFLAKENSACPIIVECVGELVVRLDCLQLLERRGHYARVDYPDARDGGGVVAQLTLAGCGRGLVRRDLRIGQPVGRPGGFDVRSKVRRALRSDRAP